MANKELIDEIEEARPQFAAALPPHIPVEKFVRIVRTAVIGDPDILNADRKSFFEAAMKCAADGLVPDKREAAFVVFNKNLAAKGKPPVWGKMVVYMPMVWGIVKKARNSGELQSIAAHVVHANDDFRYTLGDDETIHHIPLLTGERGPMTLAYGIFKTKDGGIYREIMTKEEIYAVRDAGKAQNSPWYGPFESEMWRKTVIKRLCKRAPSSSDLERLLDADNELVDIDSLRTVNQEAIPAPTVKASPLPTADEFAQAREMVKEPTDGNKEEKPAKKKAERRTAAATNPAAKEQPAEEQSSAGSMDGTNASAAKQTGNDPQFPWEDESLSWFERAKLWIEHASAAEIDTMSFLKQHLKNVPKENQAEVCIAFDNRRKQIADLAMEVEG